MAQVIRLQEPWRVPVIATGSDLPPVPVEHLELPSLTARFARPPAWQPELGGDSARYDDSIDRPPRAASVLMPLVQRPHGVQILLTRRTDHLRDHAGQISFPGGGADAGDANAVATALREAQEEVGLEPAQIDVLGTLSVYHTVSRYAVTPVVALIDPAATLRLDVFEVAEAFEVPLSFLMNPANHQLHVFDNAGVSRQFLSMPWQGVDAAGVAREYFIWGATAAMLRNFYRFLSA